MITMEKERLDECTVEEDGNVCIIEYDERSMGRAFVSKVHYPGGVDISIRFVKQKIKRNGLTYDPASAPEGLRRVTLSLAP